MQKPVLPNLFALTCPHEYRWNYFLHNERKKCFIWECTSSRRCVRIIESELKQCLKLFCLLSRSVHLFNPVDALVILSSISAFASMCIILNAETFSDPNYLGSIIWIRVPFIFFYKIIPHASNDNMKHYFAITCRSLITHYLVQDWSKGEGALFSTKLLPRQALPLSNGTFPGILARDC